MSTWYLWLRLCVHPRRANNQCTKWNYMLTFSISPLSSERHPFFFGWRNSGVPLILCTSMNMPPSFLVTFLRKPIDVFIWCLYGCVGIQFSEECATRARSTCAWIACESSVRRRANMHECALIILRAHTRFEFSYPYFHRLAGCTLLSE